MNRLRTYMPNVLIVLAALAFLASFNPPSRQRQLRSEVARVERSLHKRQRLMEQYAMKALASKDVWPQFEDFPDDMVIYCYSGDTLKFWANEFPISNDDINSYSYSYTLQYNGSSNSRTSPLAYMGVKEQYANLGSGWYVVNTQLSKDYRTRIVTGILVRTEYVTDNVPDETNRHLHFRNGFTSVSINVDDTGIVYGIEGEPLFSVVSDGPSVYRRGGDMLRWIALLVALAAAFSNHCSKRSIRTFLTSVTVLVAARVIGGFLAVASDGEVEMFSPILYADAGIFSSLGNLLLNNCFVALMVYDVFVMRSSICRYVRGRSEAARIFLSICLGICTLMLMWYIHSVLHSLIVNSNIELELSMLDSVSIYSVASLVSFAMLFLALLFLLQMLVQSLRGHSRANLFGWKYILFYIGLVALYSLIAISAYSLEREYETNRVRTAKLAVQRDLSLEIALREIEGSIANDRFISVLSGVNGIDLIRKRLIERYLSREITDRYNVRLTLCAPENYLNIGAGSDPVGCFSFYDDLLRGHGSALAPESCFYFLDNNEGESSYVGVFTYFDQNDYSISRLFMELQPRFGTATDGYPLDILSGASSNEGLPGRYSYARYRDGRLSSYDGDYTYPVVVPAHTREGYTKVAKGGYLHFINNISDDRLTVVSRQRRPFFPYMVSFSYFSLFYGLFFLLFTRWGRRTKLFSLPKHTLRRRITFLITGSMIATLVCMAVGIFFYISHLNSENIRAQISAKITTIQNALSPYCRYTLQYNDLMTEQMSLQQEETARINRTDINLYDTDGVLVKSTRPELFDQFVLGRRISDKAYRNIVINSSLRYWEVDRIAGVRFYSLYAPLFNADGLMVGIVNIPYYNRSRDLTSANLSTIPAIINLFLILFIAAITIGVILSNSFAKPIVEIKKRLDLLVTSKSGDSHLRYVNPRDEIGLLVESYNRMVDDLAESTRRLAQTEREQAWAEMARQIAHEIKNPLTPMRLSIQYLMRLKSQNYPGWEDKVGQVSKAVLEQIDKLSETANEFAHYSKFYAEEMTLFDLDQLVRMQAVLFDNRDDISVRYVQKVENPVVEARRSQIGRVLVNLLTNAVQAIDGSGRGNGSILIVLDQTLVNGEKFWSVSVADNGPGVAEEHLSSLFTPKFTTKSASGGSGLGLAISRSIMEQSGGTITYCPSEMGGACFTVTLPAR